MTVLKKSIKQMKIAIDEIKLKMNEDDSLNVEANITSFVVIYCE